MGLGELLLSLVIVWLAAKLAGEAMERVGQTAVLGELLAGVIVGPAVLGLVRESESVAAIPSVVAEQCRLDWRIVECSVEGFHFPGSIWWVSIHLAETSDGDQVFENPDGGGSILSLPTSCFHFSAPGLLVRKSPPTLRLISRR
ncbi:MAG: hypothetical protein HYW16_06445 [Candidatus Rokubacteria bacterium]|nr:hypothetical protein [Candidatus Rokubacteria bacterium]